jgi:TolB protein
VAENSWIGLFIVDIQTDVVRALTIGWGHAIFPSWSPKGDRISFTSDRSGEYDIYTIRPDATGTQPLTHSGATALTTHRQP